MPGGPVASSLEWALQEAQADEAEDEDASGDADGKTKLPALEPVRVRLGRLVDRDRVDGHPERAVERGGQPGDRRRRARGRIGVDEGGGVVDARVVGIRLDDLARPLVALAQLDVRDAGEPVGRRRKHVHRREARVGEVRVGQAESKGEGCARSVPIRLVLGAEDDCELGLALTSMQTTLYRR